MKTIKDVKKAVEGGADKQRENSGDQVFLDWCITYAYIRLNMNRYYILTSKIPNQKGVSVKPPPLVTSGYSSAWGIQHSEVI